MHAIPCGTRLQEIPAKTEAVIRLKIPAGAVPAPRGFFMKKKQCPVSLLDSKLSEIISPSSGVNFKTTSNPLSKTEQNTSFFTTSPTSSLTNCQISGEHKDLFTVKHSLSPQRLRVGKRLFAAVPKLYSTGFCSETSKPVSEESVSTARTNIRSSSRTIDQASDPTHLKDLLMSPDWQNKTLKIDQVRLLTSGKQARTRKASPCLKNHQQQQHSLDPKFRSEGTISDLTKPRSN